MFESRPFVVQASRGENSPQPDLKTSLMRAERYGHHLSQIQPFGNEATTAVQPKLETGQPIQCVLPFSTLDNMVRKKGKLKKERPSKPSAHPDLKQNDPTLGTLTAHHKYGYSKINNDVNTASGSAPIAGTATQNIENWADPKKTKPTLTQGDVAWTPHNIFMGPNPNDRLDDPGKVPGALHPDLDTHFTASGTVTPNSHLALEIQQAGGLPHFNPADLVKRLNSLPNPNQTSPFKQSEWVQPIPGKYQQAGMPAGWHTSMDINQRINYAEQKKTAKLFQELPFA
ncbi:hypothetical protein DP117_25715 [Brasilonema sp. UFV-L1]|nr:hypothetical protein [Brasilonema sp. UFV-L1]